MNLKNEEKNAGGRPPHYTPEQLRIAVGDLLDAGILPEDIDAASVRTVLCDRFKVSPGINVKCLAGHVEQVMVEYAEEQRRMLLKGLPGSVPADLDTVMDPMREEFLLLVARLNLSCQEQAERECVELRRDKANANWRSSELEAKLATQSKATADIEWQRDEARLEASAAVELASELQAKLDGLNERSVVVDQLMGALKDPAVRGDIRQFLGYLLVENNEPIPVPNTTV